MCLPVQISNHTDRMIWCIPEITPGIVRDDLLANEPTKLANSFELFLSKALSSSEELLKPFCLARTFFG